MKKTVVSFGEILWDIMPSSKRTLGGAPFNFAYRINSLGDRGLIVSSLGKDELGREALESVSALGLDVDNIQLDSGKPTGTVQVSFDKDNNPDYVIVPHVAYDNISVTADLLAVSEKADCICFGSLIQREKQSRETLRQFLSNSPNSFKFCDINLRKKCYNIDTISFSFEQAHAVKMNEDEAYQLAEMFGFPCKTIPEFCKNLIERWELRYCLVTLAECGAYVLSESEGEVYVPGYEIEMVDSLGAGDAFSAGFIHEMLRGSGLKQACRLGNTLGALVASNHGATSLIGEKDIDIFQSREIKRRYHEEFV